MGSTQESGTEGGVLTESLVVFLIISVVCVAGGLGVVFSRNVIHATFLLLVSLMGVAGIFLLLLAEFLALVQVLIYGGAITIVVLFVIMLTKSDEFESLVDNSQKPLAFLISIGLFVVMTVAAIAADNGNTVRASLKFSDLGHSLFTDWAIPFEVASLVLLVALIGAIVISKQGEEE
ncbi:MAG: NADH:ubiquinone oxidoreductase subunit J [Chloroflexi bacterium]|nr:NADH:ubiquinone oxidoreductase subunit J [Chloroflexota bacterium]